MINYGQITVITLNSIFILSFRNTTKIKKLIKYLKIGIKITVITSIYCKLTSFFGKLLVINRNYSEFFFYLFIHKFDKNWKINQYQEIGSKITVITSIYRKLTTFFGKSLVIYRNDLETKIT